MSIVPTNVNYNYTLLVQNINILNQMYPFLNIQTVSKSVLGKNIYVIAVKVQGKFFILVQFMQTNGLLVLYL